MNRLILLAALLCALAGCSHRNAEKVGDIGMFVPGPVGDVMSAVGIAGAAAGTRPGSDSSSDKQEDYQQQIQLGLASVQSGDMCTACKHFQAAAREGATSHFQNYCNPDGTPKE